MSASWDHNKLLDVKTWNNKTCHQGFFLCVCVVLFRQKPQLPRTLIMIISLSVLFLLDVDAAGRLRRWGRRRHILGCLSFSLSFLCCCCFHAQSYFLFVVLFFFPKIWRWSGVGSRGGIETDCCFSALRTKQMLLLISFVRVEQTAVEQNYCFHVKVVLGPDTHFYKELDLRGAWFPRLRVSGGQKPELRIHGVVFML